MIFRTVFRARLCCTLVAALTFSAPAFAGAGLLRDLDSTAGGYGTWDADMINVEGLPQTGKGVYVAVLDTGLVPNWRDYFPEGRIGTQAGTGFDQPVAFRVSKDDPCGLEIEVGTLTRSTWVGSTGSTHGTHVASTIIGYAYRSNFDAAAGFPLPGIVVRGIAPDVTVIPVRVLADYRVPARPRCPDPSLQEGGSAVFGTSNMIAAGIRYATDLKRAGYSPMVINLSLGGSTLDPIEQDAIDYAIANGVIVVAAAGNEGEAGMGYPGAYPPVISAGSAGWTGEWLFPSTGLPRYRMWWLKYPFAPLEVESGDVADPASIGDIYVSDFSSRELAGQELDVLAPGSWVRGPFAGDPGYNHLPWWSNGIGDLVGRNAGNFYYVGGTSMATPHVASVAALMLEKNPTLNQAAVEWILKSSALWLPAAGSRDIFDLTAPATITWDTDCDGEPCDAVGAGFLQADDALSATP